MVACASAAIVIAASRNHSRRPRSKCVTATLGTLIFIPFMRPPIIACAPCSRGGARSGSFRYRAFCAGRGCRLRPLAVDFILPAIQLFLQLVARQHDAGPRDQRLQHGPFARRQADQIAADEHLARLRIDAHAIVFEHRLGAAGRTAQQRADARQQFIEVIRFQHIVVGAGIEAGDALLLGVARRRHQHRRELLARAHRAQHLQAILARQAQVQQHQIVGLGLQGRIGHRAVLDPVDGVVLGPEQVEHHFADHRVVFHQQQSHGYPLLVLSCVLPAVRDQPRRTGMKILSSPRWISKATDLSDLATTSRTCSTLLTARPFTDSSTSPGCTPALAAAPPASSISRPLAMPDSLRSAGFRGRSDRPSFSLAPGADCSLSATLSLALASVAFSSTVFPWRQTSSATLSPGAAMPTIAGKSPEPTIFWPFTLRITSPGFRPALSAALPCSTFDTSAPSGVGRLKESAKPWFTSCTVTPSLACSTLPVATIWSLILLATSIGIANDRP